MPDASPAALDLVGLIPAAGRATRLGALPCSKEVLPLGPEPAPGAPDRRPRVCEPLLEALAAAGASRAYVVLRRGKWDVPEALGDGSRWGLPLAYLAVEPTASVPETLDRAYPFVCGSRVALGFPDILFAPPDALARVAARQLATGADAVLGLVPTDRPSKADMVDLDGEGRIRDIVIKPPASDLRYTWIFAVWGPSFSAYLHRFMGAGPVRPEGRELYPSDVVMAALREGMRIEAEVFPEGYHLDVGTPDDLARALPLAQPSG